LKLKLTQNEVDALKTVERISVPPTNQGVGRVDVPFQIRIKGKLLWQYEIWSDMLKRSYSVVTKNKQPTYKQVDCCQEWLSFACFLEWVNAQVAYQGKPEGKHLDKDILAKGNKLYSPDFCRFVPQQINKLLNDYAKRRGQWPRGVTFVKKQGKFRARVNSFGEAVQLGSFDCPEKAYQAYVIAKEAQVKLAALHYQAELKPEVFQALMSWRVS